MGMRRTIPTRVGTTLVGQGPTTWTPVHPHARGDNVAGQNVVNGFGGSPPRAWGQHICTLSIIRLNRFTPTRVGTTHETSCWASGQAVHPHARGDNAFANLFPFTIVGSPPRAWGQLLALDARRPCGRFTPTRVGTTWNSAAAERRYPVHPHARGDNTFDCSTEPCSSGSPPRAWGQHQVNRVPGASDRFTPTRVGTTAARHSNAPATTVHPHARGDNLVSPRAHPSPFGSPPRAWGQHMHGRFRMDAFRFTPTRVGTTPPAAP